MARRASVLLVLLVLVLCGAVAPAGAHGGSYDMKYVDGSNVLLLTFNTHAPVSGLDIEHDLRLYDLLGAPIVYDEVDLEVHTKDDKSGLTLRNQTLLLEKTVPMLPTNESKLTYAYPLPGAYVLRVSFRAGGRVISSGTFALDVGAGTSAPGGFPWVRLGLTLALGILVGTLLPRGRREDVGRSHDEADDAPHPDGLDEEPARELTRSGGVRADP